MTKNNYFAEIIESSITNWLAQSWSWDTFPSFGSFLAIESSKRTIFGIVYQIQTGSMDPVRYPFPYKKTEEELLKEQPQIFEFLKTTFSCITIGYQEKGTINYLIAPEPPKIHAFVYHPNLETHKIFFSNMRYLHLLFMHSATIFNLDELILAILKSHAQYALLTPEKILLFMETYSLLIGNDYRRIKLFLQRAEPLISSHY